MNSTTTPLEEKLQYTEADSYKGDSGKWSSTFVL